MNLKAQFSEKDLKTIRLFQSRVKELQNTRIIRGGVNLNFNFWDDLSFSQKEQHLEKEETIKAFTVAFRHFYLQKEPINFFKFHNTILPRISDPQAVAVLASLRDRYARVLNSSGSLTYYYKGEKVTPATIIDLWLNAHYFHSHNDALRKKLNDWLKRAGGIFQFLFLDAVEELSAILIYYAKILDLIMGPKDRAP